MDMRFNDEFALWVALIGGSVIVSILITHVVWGLLA